MENNGKDFRRNILNKMFLIYVVFGVVVLLILIRIIYLQTRPEEEWKNDIKTITNELTHTKRGNILSSDGYYLAASLPFYSAHWDLSIIKRDTFYHYIDTLAACMSSYFKDRTKEEYKKEYVDAFEKKKQYHKVKLNLTQEEYNAIQTFPIFNMRKNRSGFIHKTEYKRQVISSLMATRTIGQVSKNDEGQDEYKAGLEAAFNEYLQGKEQYILKHKISSGQYVPYDINEENMQDPGSDVVSTIKFNIQDITEKCLLAQLQKYNAKIGTAVVMEVKTGKIRAMINLERDSLSNNYREMLNHAVRSRIEPGSTFKLASMIAILESGAFDINDTIDTGNGVLQIGSFTMSDDHKGGLGKLSVEDVFAKSSNVGFGAMVIKAFNNGMYNYNDPLLARTRLRNPDNEKNINYFIDRLCDMHINQKLGIKIDGEGTPYIKYPGNKSWSITTLPQTAIGYELLVTPLQILTLYNAIANNGVMVKPQFIEEVKLYGETTKKFDPEIIDPSICSQSTVEKLQKMLESVVEKGTASNIRTDRYRIAGKTGTAQIAIGNTGYSGKHRASFAGYFPADNPKYSCIVIISEPEGSIYGGQVAAPVFRQIADKLYTYESDMHSNTEYNIAALDDKPSTPKTKIGSRSAVDRIYSQLHVELENADNSNTQWVQTQPSPNKRKALMEAYSTPRGLVPDVVGLGLRDALYLLRQRSNLIVKVVGHGTVVHQDKAPRSKLEGIKEIKITLQ